MNTASIVSAVLDFKCLCLKFSLCVYTVLKILRDYYFRFSTFCFLSMKFIQGSQQIVWWAMDCSLLWEMRCVLTSHTYSIFLRIFIALRILVINTV
jgi:hypothetical protein